LRIAKSAFEIAALVPLEVLHRALVLLGGGAGLEVPRLRRRPVFGSTLRE
jgi:hypothetical protein